MRSERHLSGREREEISRGLAAGEPARQPAKRLGRSPSTISREIACNGRRDRYRAASADAAAYERGRRPKQAKLAQRPALRALVEAKLALCWSPEQIAGWLRRQVPGDASMQISHEAIYLSLYDPRQAIDRSLTQRLRSGRPMRRPRSRPERPSPALALARPGAPSPGAPCPAPGPRRTAPPQSPARQGPCPLPGHGGLRSSCAPGLVSAGRAP
ncbi:transposase [Streptomyces sp. NPDC059118]|uniref:transposase n=1 Tax=unclassified Streptomyces TaxID=2593676 RepID=UPI0036CC8CB5